MAATLGVAVLVTAAGCSDVSPGSDPGAAGSPSGANIARSGSATPRASASPSVPRQGRTLASWGISNGPREDFSIPADAVIAAESDRPNLVEIAVNAPKPARMEHYLYRALPAAGFRVTGHHTASAEPAISFTGHGWVGRFTGHGTTSGITLRPVG